jgi:type I site-specific restriction-modification system R (restriction) subunit
MPEEKDGKAPELTKRRNIIVIADEADRSQYDLIDGLARSGATRSRTRGKRFSQRSGSGKLRG